MESTGGGSSEHRTVSRVIGILEFVARSGQSVRFADIVNELNAPRSSVHGLVQGLVSTGYLRVTEDGRYSLGAGVSALVLQSPVSDQAVRSALETLSLEFDETVTLTVMAGDSILTVDAIESSKAIRYNPTIGLRRPLYPTSAGKCFLANAAFDYREKYLARKFPTVAERDRVLTELLQVREDGFAINRGDTLPDLSAVSVPVFEDLTVTSAITVAGPSSRFESSMDEIVTGVRDAAARASRAR